MDKLDETLAEVTQKLPENFRRFHEIEVVWEGPSQLLKVHVGIVELFFQQIQPENRRGKVIIKFLHDSCCISQNN